MLDFSGIQRTWKKSFSACECLKGPLLKYSTIHNNACLLSVFMFEMSRLRFFSVKLSRFLLVCFLLLEAGAQNPSAPLENQELSDFQHPP